MNLGEMKQKVLRMIEEINPDSIDLTEDPDLKNKINDVIDQVQFELARIKKIAAIKTVEVKEGQNYDLSELDRFYQLERIKGVRYEHFGVYVEFEEAGTAKFYYYRYPEKINHESNDTTELEISEDAQEAMVYGVSADLLKNDAASNFGRMYAERYMELKNQLDPRYSIGNVSMEGGMDI